MNRCRRHWCGMDVGESDDSNQHTQPTPTYTVNKKKNRAEALFFI